MKKTSYIALLLIFCLSIFSCGSDTLPVTVIQLDEDLELHLWQNLTTDGAQAQIKLVTTDLYDCAEARIISDLSTFGKSINLELTAIEQPDNCATASATQITSLHPIDFGQGQYDIRITLGDLITNEGEMSFSNEKIELSLHSSNGLKFNNSTLQRIPNNIVWGYIIHPDHQAAITDELLDSIEISNSSGLSAGNYTYFKVNNNGSVNILDTNQEHTGFVINYQSSSDWEQIKSNFAASNQVDDADIYIQNYNGEFLRN